MADNKWDKYKVVNYSPEITETKSTDKWSKYKVSSGIDTAQRADTKFLELGNIPKTEEKISQRKSMLADLIQDPTSIKRMIEHPVGTPLRALGGAAELVEGITSDVALGLQAGKPERILSDIGKTVTGKRPAELGDVFRGIGVPEPMAATLGLLSSGAKYMPTELFSGGVTKSAGKITQLPRLMTSFGKPFVSKSLSVLSGIPQDDVIKAIDNPNILSKGWINKEKSIVEDMYSKELEPSIQNLQNKVKTTIPEVKQTLEGIKLNINNQPTRAAATMKTSELSDIERWMDKLKKPQLTLNETDALIGEMDLGLQKFYKAKDVGKLEPITKTYERLTLELRNALKASRDKSFPKLAPKFDRYSKLKTAERIYSNFDRWQPKLLNMAIAGTIAGPLGQALGIPWATVSSLTMGSTVPKIQAGAIRAGSQIAKEATKSAAVPLMGATQLLENR